MRNLKDKSSKDLQATLEQFLDTASSQSASEAPPPDLSYMLSPPEEVSLGTMLGHYFENWGNAREQDGLESDLLSSSIDPWEYQQQPMLIPMVLFPGPEEVTPYPVDFDEEPVDEHQFKLNLAQFEWLHSDSPLREKAPPDISEGLGKDQSKRDITALASFISQELPLMLYRDNLYCYDGRRWKILKKDQCPKYLRRHLLQYPTLSSTLTTSEYTRIYNQLKIMSELERDEDFVHPEEMLNLKDAVLDLKTMQFLPHSPDFGFFDFLNVSKQELVDPVYGETFETFVFNLSGGNPVIRTQILEMIAIAALGLEIKHFYVLCGAHHTGKTQLLRFVEEFLGRENIVSISEINKLGDKFGLAEFEGKRIATCHDIPDRPLSIGAVGMIKQLVGDDPIQVEAKYQNGKTLFNKPLLLLAGNHALKIPNASKEQALLDRMVVIPFQQTVAEEKRIRQLYNRLLSEAPYIMNQAIKAYQDLVDRNFVVTRSEVPPEYQPVDGRSEFQMIKSFIENNCLFDPEAQTKSNDFYQAYLAQTGSDVGFTAFGRLLSDVLDKFGTNVKKLKRVGNSEQKGYQGIRLISDIDQ